ncbi:glycosyltransferase family 92 protein [Weissella koreensis]|uniref:Glycosyltransferase family 2 protein n=1 Tax=Weissella koreensis TaxID=165096 RepID=A0A7H1ML64_9LACO|nr:glycosyltransferase family 92 protein [Weissella koreensis]AVH74996.1 hypothetical protein C4597_02735 [Weissella koreensis]QGN20222.1 hypothetical protein GKC51_02720 [Weissella koreensis]QNT64200.1 hypothetical protein FY536_02440 [Weissella koreensis]
MRYKQEMPRVKRTILKRRNDGVSFLRHLKYLQKYGLSNIHQRLHDNNTVKEFKHQLGVVAIVKNEAPYLKEWIEFHKLVGVDVFYLYDNESSDNIMEVLQPYINQGLVKYELVKGKNKQIDVYNESIVQYRNDVRWLAIIDADEFIVPVEKENILDMINSLDKSFSQILVGWLIYGSNGLKKKQEGLVTDNFKYHARSDFIADYKPILNPRLVMNVVTPHWANVIGKTIDENGKRIWGYPYHTKIYAVPASKNKIRINHYYSKSLEEFIKKSERGYADYDGSDRMVRDMDAFHEHDQNYVTDTVINKYSDILRKELGVTKNED